MTNPETSLPSRPTADAGHQRPAPRAQAATTTRAATHPAGQGTTQTAKEDAEAGPSRDVHAFVIDGVTEHHDQVAHALARLRDGRTTRLHYHRHGEPCVARCTTYQPAAERRPEPLREEHHDDSGSWVIEAHDDQPIAPGQRYAADLRVVLTLDGRQLREFTYPAYRIWTLLAHWTDGLGDLAEVPGGGES